MPIRCQCQSGKSTLALHDLNHTSETENTLLKLLNWRTVVIQQHSSKYYIRKHQLEY